MHKVPTHLLEKFSEYFAYQKLGFKLKDITPHFSKYQAGLPSPESNGVKAKKGDHFVRIVGLLEPKQQRYALWDLCSSPPSIPNCPNESIRIGLLNELFASDGITPLGIALSDITLDGIRESWWTATSRLTVSSAAAVTAARTLLESTCRTISSELDGSSDDSGDLKKLCRKTRDQLGLKTGKNVPKEMNELVSGIESLTNALASLSNSAGDRHGSESGIKLEDSTVACLAVHASGVLSYGLARIYLDYRFSALE